MHFIEYPIQVNKKKSLVLSEIQKRMDNCNGMLKWYSLAFNSKIVFIKRNEH